MMEYTERGSKRYLIGYHTQECRSRELETPIRSLSQDSWLGCGYYFWAHLEFAKYWGEDFKKDYNGFYDIYKAELDISNCLNASFDEEGYQFFLECITETIENLKRNNPNQEILLHEVNAYLYENYWQKKGITGIIYDDLPANPKDKDRLYSEIEKIKDNPRFFYYKKRIQIILFEKKFIHNFSLDLFEQT